MDLIEAIDILRLHNQWRRDLHDEMQDPKKIGEALDLVLDVITADQNLIETAFNQQKNS
jgi:hypothetical protein